ncbi:DUF2304 domain-containing protein [bacterium]|nr:DUF2304 domain-containing protein [bacterium]
MTSVLRLIMLVAALLTAGGVLAGIRSARMRMKHALYWMLFLLVIIAFAVFPQLAYWGAGLMGIQTPFVFVFLTVIALLVLKLFRQTQQISELESRLDGLAENIAIQDFESLDGDEASGRPADAATDVSADGASGAAGRGEGGAVGEGRARGGAS